MWRERDVVYGTESPDGFFFVQFFVNRFRFFVEEGSLFAV